MSSTRNQEQKEELEAISRMWSHMFGFHDTMALKCAAKLGLADIISSHGEPMTLAQLSSALPFQPVSGDNLYRLMRYLVHMDLFTKVAMEGDQEERYGLTPTSRMLLKDGEKTMLPQVAWISYDIHTSLAHSLADCVEGGHQVPLFDREMGLGFFEYAAKHPSLNRAFNDAMAYDSKKVMSVLIRDAGSVFEGVGSLVDVGGGTGLAAKAIVAAFPHIKCVVYELPHVVAQSEPQDGVTFLEGNMFESVPAGADAIFMKFILHDWSDGQCLEILRNCRNAISAEEGKIIIVEVVVVDAAQENELLTRVKLGLDLTLMTLTAGRERTAEEWRSLLQNAGFSRCKITHIMALQSVIEAYP